MCATMTCRLRERGERGARSHGVDFSWDEKVRVLSRPRSIFRTLRIFSRAQKKSRIIFPRFLVRFLSVARIKNYKIYFFFFFRSCFIHRIFIDDQWIHGINNMSLFISDHTHEFLCFGVSIHYLRCMFICHVDWKVTVIYLEKSLFKQIILSTECRKCQRNCLISVAKATFY